MKPRIFYLTVFPDTYRDKTWWSAKHVKCIPAYLQHIKELYGVKGKVIKVQEYPKTTRKKKQ